MQNWRRLKTCHKILKHQETVKFSILKKDPLKKKKKKEVSVGLDEMWAPLSKHDLFDDLKVNDKGS